MFDITHYKQVNKCPKARQACSRRRRWEEEGEEEEEAGGCGRERKRRKRDTILLILANNRCLALLVPIDKARVCFAYSGARTRRVSSARRTIFFSRLLPHHARRTRACVCAAVGIGEVRWVRQESSSSGCIPAVNENSVRASAGLKPWLEGCCRGRRRPYPSLRLPTSSSCFCFSCCWLLLFVRHLNISRSECYGGSRVCSPLARLDRGVRWLQRRVKRFFVRSPPRAPPYLSFLAPSPSSSLSSFAFASL